MKKGYKECPFCLNEIKEKAIKCQYCGEFIKQEQTKQEETEEQKKKVVKQTKECPFCLNNIDKDLTVCPFCEESLNNKSNEVKENLEEQEVFDEAKINSSNFEDLSPKEKKIKKSITYIDRAFGRGCFSILVSLIIYIVNLTQNKINILDISIVDLIYLGVLVYFIYKRNRMAALFFFIEFALSSIAIINGGNKINAFRVIVAFFLGMGVYGAFQYHSLTNQKKLSKSEIVILIIGIIVTIISIIGVIDSF